MNQELTNNPFNPAAPAKVFDEIKVSLASARTDPFVVLWRDQEARDDQLPHVQARA
jgi:hypothetical protein